MATEQLKKLVAQEIALGLKRTDIARLHGYTPNGLYKLIQTPEMKDLIKDQESLLAARQLRSRIYFADYVDNASKNIIAIAGDTDHKDSYKANQFIAEQFTEQKKEIDTRVEVNITGDIMHSVKQSFEKMASGFVAKQISHSIEDHLYEGEEALPKPLDTDYDAVRPKGNGGTESTGD